MGDEAYHNLNRDHVHEHAVTKFMTVSGESCMANRLSELHVIGANFILSFVGICLVIRQAIKAFYEMTSVACTHTHAYFFSSLVLFTVYLLLYIHLVAWAFVDLICSSIYVHTKWSY